jgi:hypothetical protein
MLCFLYIVLNDVSYHFMRIKEDMDLLFCPLNELTLLYSFVQLPLIRASVRTPR